MAGLPMIRGTAFNHNVCALCGTESMLPGLLGDDEVPLCYDAGNCYKRVKRGEVPLPDGRWWRQVPHPMKDAAGNFFDKLFPEGPWTTEPDWITDATKQ